HVMNGAGGQFLSRAVLAGDKGRNVSFSGSFNQRANVIDFRTCTQDALGGESLFDFFSQVQVFLDQFLLADLQFRERLRILQGDGGLICQSLNEVLVFGAELSIAFVEDLNTPMISCLGVRRGTLRMLRVWNPVSESIDG